MKKFLRHVTAASLLLAAMSAPSMAQGNLGSDFTYQGKVQLSGVPVTGTADFQFRLFDSNTGGNQIGSTISYNEVNLVDGLITANLNFGSTAFNGDTRHLEIAVRSPANTGNFVILTPRQKLSGAPYALKVPGVDGHSLNSPNGSMIDALFVNNSGDVGISTTNPQGRFDVRSGNGSYFRIDTVNGDVHVNGGTDLVAGIYNDSQSVQARTDFIVNGGAHMVVNGAGKVGVGTLTPPRKLSVSESDFFTCRFESNHPLGSVAEFSNTSSQAVWEFGVTGAQPPFPALPGSMYFYKQGEIDVHMTIAPNAWIGLGVPNPGYRLDLPNIANADGRGRANRWDTYSSARWKHNVQPIENALDKVLQLRGVTFDWNADNGGAHDVGFIAEEVGSVVPELVTWEADGKNAQGLAYDRVTALTVEAIKDQQRQIDELRKSNDELRGLVEALVANQPAAK
jgi:hypothetical protein